MPRPAKRLECLQRALARAERRGVRAAPSRSPGRSCRASCAGSSAADSRVTRDRRPSPRIGVEPPAPVRLGFPPDRPQSRPPRPAEAIPKGATWSRMRIRTTIGILGISAVGTRLCRSAAARRSPTQPRPPVAGQPDRLRQRLPRLGVARRRSAPARSCSSSPTRRARAEALAISRSGQHEPDRKHRTDQPAGDDPGDGRLQPRRCTRSPPLATGTDAQLSPQPSPIRSARIRIGRERPSASNDLLQP